ncbi:NADH dehydrogenase [ubiquinone] 1 alpha subcomplex subunit 8 [Macrobrachium rosenbergii]|uniref:NADH dehydrogenase [ubiquinone] 1 alpha subcomplex subunit 8 n=1 Tax=Macrobrachium rosenbergii TaxID=79674 RepID=UPI0034D5A094
MYTKDFELPAEEELTVQEINISTPYLKAGAFHLGKHCEEQNNDFMLCRKEENDPRKCLGEGKEVTACALDFFRKIKKSCLEEFNQYANCLDKSSKDFQYRHCRNTQSVFDKCVLDNLGIERPEFGYFCRPKVVNTKRPLPEPEALPEFPGAAEPIPPPPVKGTARYGTRLFWME